MKEIEITFATGNIEYSLHIPKNRRRFEFSCEGDGVTEEFKDSLKQLIDYDDGIWHFDKHINLCHSTSNGTEEHCIAIVKVIQYLCQFGEFIEQFKYKWQI